MNLAKEYCIASKLIHEMQNEKKNHFKKMFPGLYVVDNNHNRSPRLFPQMDEIRNKVRDVHI